MTGCERDILDRDGLIRESWEIYKNFGEKAFVVKPSIPILFFGNCDRYSASDLRVITVGLNPSRIEFPGENRFRRFNGARKVYPSILAGSYYDEYWHALRDYFLEPPNCPYEPWFNSFEPLLAGLDCSYYGKASNTALHTDLCSPLATDSTWNKLPRETQMDLIECGAPLWHSLVGWLSPHLIIVSVARSHLNRVKFPQQDGWSVAHTIERTNPYTVEITKLRLPDGRIANLVFGKAANKPFGTVSNTDKLKIGLAIQKIIVGDGPRVSASGGGI